MPEALTEEVILTPILAEKENEPLQSTSLRVFPQTHRIAGIDSHCLQPPADSDRYPSSNKPTRANWDLNRPANPQTHEDLYARANSDAV